MCACTCVHVYVVYVSVCVYVCVRSITHFQIGGRILWSGGRDSQGKAIGSVYSVNPAVRASVCVCVSVCV